MVYFFCKLFVRVLSWLFGLTDRCLHTDFYVYVGAWHSDVSRHNAA
nr:MAG TPA: hypothetical protein [Caudoviricetes sp.]